jgi:hypothetical protein
LGRFLLFYGDGGFDCLCLVLSSTHWILTGFSLLIFLVQPLQDIIAFRGELGLRGKDLLGFSFLFFLYGLVLGLSISFYLGHHFAAFFFFIAYV